MLRIFSFALAVAGAAALVAPSGVAAQERAGASSAARIAFVDRKSVV